jgi:hypothetical protein
MCVLNGMQHLFPFTFQNSLKGAFFMTLCHPYTCPLSCLHHHQATAARSQDKAKLRLAALEEQMAHQREERERLSADIQASRTSTQVSAWQGVRVCWWVGVSWGW